MTPYLYSQVSVYIVFYAKQDCIKYIHKILKLISISHAIKLIPLILIIYYSNAEELVKITKFRFCYSLIFDSVLYWICCRVGDIQSKLNIYS